MLLQFCLLLMCPEYYITVRPVNPTFISPTDEIHRKSLLKRDGIKKKNEYELDEERMRENSAQGDRDQLLILMKGLN